MQQRQSSPCSTLALLEVKQKSCVKDMRLSGHTSVKGVLGDRAQQLYLPVPPLLQAPPSCKTASCSLFFPMIWWSNTSDAIKTDAGPIKDAKDQSTAGA